MRVVITGATGNVGTSVVSALVADPEIESIVGIARRAPVWTPAKTTFVPLDIRHDDLGPVLRGADALIHLAWAFQSTHDPVSTWEANVRGSLRVFAAAADAGIGTLVHASSVGTYRAREGDDPVDESWPTDALPTAAYGREKAYLERVLDRFEVDHPEVRVVRMRPCFLFKQSAAVSQLRIFGGPLVPGRILLVPLPLVPLPAGLRFQALHTDDVAEAFRLALHRPVCGPFNLAAGRVIDADGLARHLGGRAVEVPARALRFALAAAWHARLVPASPQLLDLFLGLPLLDPGRAHRELGWQPRHTSDDAIAAVIRGARHGDSFPTPPLRPTEHGPFDALRILREGSARAGQGPSMAEMVTPAPAC